MSERKPRRKILPVVLSETDYRALQLWGWQEERDPAQQVRWLVKRAIRGRALSEQEQTELHAAMIAEEGE